MFTLLNLFYFNIFLVLISAKYLFPEHAVIVSKRQQSEKSHFGFSVQLQAAAANLDGRVLVGAPKSSDEFQNNLIEPGAVFSCSLEAGKTCQQYEFDTKGTTDYEHLKGRNYSSLGFSLDADEDIDGRLVACAPRWVNYKNNEYSIPKLNGMCYHIKNGKDTHNAEKLMPLEFSDSQFEAYTYNYILGEAGFTSHLIQDSETVAFTALGLKNWTGSIIQYDETGNKVEKNVIVPANKFAKIETYSYFGYSLSSGRFNSSDRNKRFYVSGAPRSNNLTGTVYIYEKQSNQVFTKRYEFPGKQFGEYYGASLAVADLNGDGIDDLIVGAPMHSTKDNEEIGCIYMYITKTYDTSIKVAPKDKLIGAERAGRFGTSLSSVGDINKDGCEDIVVGAPYYQESGAIYLYLGQKGDQPLKLFQRILASDCSPNLRGFGFSLSRGTDIDNNHYNDLAVGSYLSGHVVVLKSRPIVNIIPRLLTLTTQIDVNTKTFNLTSCIKYATKDVPEVLQITTELRVDRSQIKFDNNENFYSRQYTYKKNIESCIHLAMTIQDGLMHDSKFTMSYEINNQDSKKEFCKFCPIEEEHKPPKFLHIPFASGCSETICKSNLKLSASFFNTKSPLIIGSEQEIQIKVIVENLGENAFGAKLFMHVSSSGLTTRSENFCTASQNNITCDFIRPLISNDKRDLMFILNHESLPISEKLLNVTLSVTSSSEDVDSTDNIISLELPLSTDVKYNIETKSEPEQLLMTENITSSVKFVHNYNIENEGITKLEILEFYVYIPYRYKEQTIVDNILYSGCNCQDIEETVDANYEVVSNEIENKIVNLNCTSTQTENLKCKKILCDVRGANKIISAKVTISFNVNISAFHEEINSVYLISTFEPSSEYLSIKSYTQTSLIAVPKAASSTLYLIIGFVVGFLLLVIVALILYKVGFFKRHRPQKPEDQGLLEEKEETENSTKVAINEEGNKVRKEEDITKDESDG